MKPILPILIALSFLLPLQALSAQEERADRGAEVIRKAMKDELARNMEELSLQDLKKPFFLAYTICDARSLSITATLGALVHSEETPFRRHAVRVLVGDYGCDNENFVDMDRGRGSMSIGGGGRIPLENDYAAIRRSLWMETDEQYKEAAEAFESKLSAMKQQNLSPEEEGLPDFSRAEPVQMKIEGPDFAFDKAGWEEKARDLSSVFSAFHDIHASKVSLFFYRADAYHLNSEGTETKYPVSLAALRVTAQTQADAGELLAADLLYYGVTPSDIPEVGRIKAEVKAMAERLVVLRNAPVFDDAYSGPVLFEDQAVAEAMAQRLFSGSSGLAAVRKPIFGQAQMGAMLARMMGKSLEDRLDKKIMDDTLTIKAVPKLEEYDGQKLVGHFAVDAEGVVPAEELVLVEQGVLKTLLNGRTPTEKIPGSNGHNRYALQFGGISPEIGPGVIQVIASEGVSKEALKERLIELAREEDLDYAIIVRKMESPTAGIEREFDPSSLMAMATGGGRQDSLSRPISVYRVSLEDGSEELLRSTELGGLSVSAFKKIAGICGDSQVYNTLLEKSVGGLGLSAFAVFMSGGSAETLSGMPASLIVPNAVLFEELELRQHKRAITQKPPVVENPVGL